MNAKFKKIIGLVLVVLFIPLAIYFLLSARIGAFAILAGAMFLIAGALKKTPTN